jgi:hypothetical protein
MTACYDRIYVENAVIAVIVSVNGYKKSFAVRRGIFCRRMVKGGLDI